MPIIAFLFEHPFVVPIFLLVFPLVLRRRSWFVTYSALLGSFFLIVWGIDSYQTSRPGYEEHGAGAAFGYALLTVLTCSYVLGVIFRILLYVLLQLLRSWREMQPNHAPQREGREAAHFGRSSSAPARGRERSAS
jgi:hypothetical protein